MRQVLPFILFLFASFTCLHAQDTIVRKNGEMVLSKVLEVGTTELKYKRTDSPDGPVYVVQKWELRYVVYANGRKESFEDVTPPPPPVENQSLTISGPFYYYKDHRITETDMLAVAKQRKDKKLDLMIRKVQEKKLIQTSCIFAGIGLFAVGAYLDIANTPKRGRRGSPYSTAASATARQNGQYMMLGGLGCGLATIYFKIDRTRHAHILVDAYNKSLAR
ncbi:MAG: hypothetical protein ACHQRM_15785 [Bacteroidia bacterium]